MIESMVKMKLVWLCPYPLDHINGIKLNRKVKGNGLWLVNLANELRKRSDLDFHIVTYTAQINKNIQISDNGIKFHILKYQIPFIKKGFPSIFRIDVLFWYFPLVGRILNLLNDINPDIVHAHGTENCYSLVANRYKKCPSIISIQGIINDLVKFTPSFYFYLQKYVEKSSVKNGLNFGCRTDWDRSFVSSTNPEAKIFYLPEAIGRCFFDTVWEGVGTESVTFIGSIMQRKGVTDLIKAFKLVNNKFPNTKLNLIGTGDSDYIAKIKVLIIQLGLENNINWLGNLNSQQIAVLLQHTSVYVLPSYSDNSPNSLCEAMAVGVPTVAYSTGGISSLINNGVTGFLVDEGNIIELGNCIAKILSESEEQSRISFSAREVAIKRNDPVFVAEKYLDCYKELV